MEKHCSNDLNLPILLQRALQQNDVLNGYFAAPPLARIAGRFGGGPRPRGTTPDSTQESVDYGAELRSRLHPSLRRGHDH